MVQKEDDKHVDWIPEQLTRKAPKYAANYKCECHYIRIMDTDLQFLCSLSDKIQNRP